VDRFLAALGAHQLAGGQPVCVVSAGTAVTIDLVDASGVHRGGAILPGPELMIRSLLENTDGIERRARSARSMGYSTRGGVRARQRESDLFARSTRAAIEQGASQAIGALVDRAVARARYLAGRAPLVVLTGGAAKQLRRSFGTRAVLASDLVLRGLALYAGLNLSAPARIRSGSQGPRN
jgi:type III pantothenate kinase